MLTASRQHIRLAGRFHSAYHDPFGRISLHTRYLASDRNNSSTESNFYITSAPINGQARRWTLMVGQFTEGKLTRGGRFVALVLTGPVIIMPSLAKVAAAQLQSL